MSMMTADEDTMDISNISGEPSSDASPSALIAKAPAKIGQRNRKNPRERSDARRIRTPMVTKIAPIPIAMITDGWKDKAKNNGFIYSIHGFFRSFHECK